MQIKDSTFLVIGGAGFIGSHIVDLLLSEGAKHVRIYDNFSRGSLNNLSNALEDPRVEVFSDGGDILHQDMLTRAMENIDGVFHLAALWLLQCLQYPRSAFDVNVTGTLNVIESCIASGIKRLVFSSSASVYGDAVTEPMDENHPYNCQEFYGASKVCGEVLARALFNWARQKGRSGFEYIGLRYMNVYGPRQCDKGAYLGVIISMLNALDAGEQPSIHGDGLQSYDFIDVRDCARANILAMQSTQANCYYNVGTGVKTSIRELAQKISEIYPRKFNVQFKESDRPFVRNRVGATQKALKDLGFQSGISLEQGLFDLIDWRANQQK